MFIISFPEKWILCVGRRYQHCVVICIRRINAEQDAYRQAGQDVTATHLLILYNAVCCLSPGHLIITGVWSVDTEKTEKYKKCLPLMTSILFVQNEM